MNKREWMLQAALAVLGSGKDFNIDKMADAYDAIVAATPDPVDEGWIEHRGEKPYPEGRVEVRFRSGLTVIDDADEWVWTHEPLADEGDIVAWRPV